ncbi:MAG: hypothetical protein PHS41_11390 [Victivallaceae bacterium]|nr:hypothetical protein [Victivallaceae bacterium]
MRTAVVLILCAAALLIGGGCGLTVPQPNPLGVDESVADAAQIVQSIKNDFVARKTVIPAKTNVAVVPAEVQPDIKPNTPEPPEIATVSAEPNWFEKNWPWLSWMALLLVFGIMYLADKCSEKWGVPSRETMARLSYYLTKGLPLTQRTIYAGIRTKYLRKNAENKASEDA